MDRGRQTEARATASFTWTRLSLSPPRTYEISDLDDGEVGQLRSYENELAMLLSEDGVNAVAEAVEPGSVRGCPPRNAGSCRSV